MVAQWFCPTWGVLQQPTIGISWLTTPPPTSSCNPPPWNQVITYWLSRAGTTHSMISAGACKQCAICKVAGRVAALVSNPPSCLPALLYGWHAIPAITVAGSGQTSWILARLWWHRWCLQSRLARTDADYGANQQASAEAPQHTSGQNPPEWNPRLKTPLQTWRNIMPANTRALQAHHSYHPCKPVQYCEHCSFTHDVKLRPWLSISFDSMLFSDSVAHVYKKHSYTQLLHAHPNRFSNVQ